MKHDTVDLNSLFPGLIHQLLDPVFVVDRNGCIVFVSEACEAMFGYTPAEMTGQPVLGYLHPDDLERTRDAASRVMEGQPHIDFENRYLHRDGRVVNVLWSARWLPDQQVRIAVARDVTSLRRADQIRDALYRISQSAHEAESLRALCQDIHRVIGGLFSSDALYLAFYDADNGQISYPYLSVRRGDSWVAGPLQDGTALAAVIRTGQPVLSVADPERPGLGMAPDELDEPVHNWLGVPLEARGRVLGAVVMESRAVGERYSTEDRDLLQFVATQLATAVERKHAEDELRHMAHHDPLTGLTNRSLFRDRLETALRQARRQNVRLALLYLDLNGFKQVNDTRGHDLGDRLLCEVARRLERTTREADTVARMGGDEFTVLLNDVSDEAAARATLEKIRAALSAPLTLAGEPVRIDSAIGLALYPDDGDTAEALLRAADADMYQMKRDVAATAVAHQ